MNKRFEAGVLILRLVLGLTFFVHGLTKFQDGIGNTAAWFDSIGIPGFAAYIVAIIELVGGLAMIVGFGIRIVSVLFALVMLGAIINVKFEIGFLGNQQMAGYELDLALLAMSVMLGLSGSRLLSLDRLLFRSKA
ncbi:DoxX family protein [Paenibacillus mendelii]|uniref:DoxX family protein n=1 Tax=Paenibacillus mendelii TaxID=206163 RepID=A0ABV6J8X4_9BACL|nr:DoxX family protein [Paenibacillus mendelii]MCQ6559671.1 DoxX family protein [Paenibacillus mendelii]